MADTVVTRIRLPDVVHRRVKAQAVYHGINLDQALGMCVSFLCSITTPLLWRTNLDTVVNDLYDWAVDDGTLDQYHQIK